MKTKLTGRKDHYLPQGYLRGFIDPARTCQKPLWHFDVLNNRWSEKSTKEIGHRPGYYDYATNAAGLEPADVTFRQLESNFPSIREKIENKFAAWTDHLDFLLRFAQMMRARSLLFFEQQRERLKNTPTWRIKEVLPDGKSLKLESMTPSPPSEAFIRNRTILEMQAEIKKGAAWANDYHWALQYTDTPDEPFIISESPFASTTDHPPRLLLLPISWRACLYGTLEDYGSEARRVDIENLRQIRSMYRRGAKLYIVSPKKLTDL
jgi:hypothetical protein